MVIIDDHQVFAGVLAEVFVARGLDVVGIYGTLADGMAAVAAIAPDLVVLDHRLPGGTGASSVRTLKERSPGTRVLMHGSNEFSGGIAVPAALAALGRPVQADAAVVVREVFDGPFDGVVGVGAFVGGFRVGCAV